MSLNQIDQTLFAELFTVCVLGLGYAVGVTDQQIAVLDFYTALIILRKRECAHDSTVCVEWYHALVSQQQRRQMPGISVGEGSSRLIIGREEESRVFFGRGMRMDLLVELRD